VNGKIGTFSGLALDTCNPKPEQISLEDIDHALNRIVRFNGHTRRPITVAEHSIRVSRIVSVIGGGRDAQFLGLLHDAAEAYVGDIVRPVKSPEICTIEDRILSAILTKFGLEPSEDDWAHARYADDMALFLEAMIEMESAAAWAVKLITKTSLMTTWALLPCYAPRPGESWSDTVRGFLV
jgi:hypothetical protein